jgi:threonine synthase
MDSLPSIAPSLEAAMGQGYHANARLVLGSLLDDITPDEISGCVEAAYADNFDTPAVTPVTPMGADWLLELHHGPTSAFKDIALQMLPQLMRVAREGTDERVMIVCATSGDTGKAALAGFADVAGCGVTVFYPAGKVSDIQRLQMVTQPGANVNVCAVEGTFDDCQTAVKRTFADTALAMRLAKDGVVLSSANSINVGRLVPQVTYYLDAYAQLSRRGTVTLGDPVDFFVPTGNFGDVLAGYYAKRMGLPVGRLVVASNSNDVLYDFISTGTYDRRRPFVKTISPSMDILVSSNLERLLFYLSDGDCELVASLMSDLDEKGSYTVPPSILERLHETFSAGRATDEQTAEAIRSTWEGDHVLLDPHTAVAKHVLDGDDGEAPRVCLSTASPFKFSADVLRALGEDAPADGFACMDALAGLSGLTPPSGLSSLRDAEVRFSDVVATDGLEAYVESACARTFA